jgi:hypothetical protein
MTIRHSRVTSRKMPGSMNKFHSRAESSYMRLKKRYGYIAGSGLLILSLAVGSGLRAKDEKPAGKEDRKPAAGESEASKAGVKQSAVKAFMHKKLHATQEILEGLALEDFEEILKGARVIKGMTVAAEFMVLEDADYVEFAQDFRRSVARLEKAGAEKKLDSATLAFMDVTMNCVECHKHVRSRAKSE